VWEDEKRQLRLFGAQNAAQFSKTKEMRQRRNASSAQTQIAGLLHEASM